MFRSTLLDFQACSSRKAHAGEMGSAARRAEKGDPVDVRGWLRRVFIGDGSTFFDHERPDALTIRRSKRRSSLF